MLFLPGYYYHVYNRGNNRQAIFLEEENYDFFLRRLHYYFDLAGVQLAVYCLMPNHFHLVISFSREIDFSNLMRSFSISYVRSFNTWHARTGHLFEGDFQARDITTQGHLPHVCRYIHLNPVKAGLVNSPEQWVFSDYRDWISDRLMPSNSLTESESLGHPWKLELRNELFGSGEAYKKFVMDFADEQRREAEIEKLLFG